MRNDLYWFEKKIIRVKSCILKTRERDKFKLVKKKGHFTHF